MEVPNIFFLSVPSATQKIPIHSTSVLCRILSIPVPPANVRLAFGFISLEIQRCTCALQIATLSAEQKQSVCKNTLFLQNDPARLYMQRQNSLMKQATSWSKTDGIAEKCRVAQNVSGIMVSRGRFFTTSRMYCYRRRNYKLRKVKRLGSVMRVSSLCYVCFFSKSNLCGNLNNAKT